MQFPQDDVAYVSASLSDNGLLACQLNPAVTVNQQTDAFVWLDCIDGYTADFSWNGPNPVSYSTPGGFEGTFGTTPVQVDGDVPTWDYLASVWGC